VERPGDVRSACAARQTSSLRLENSSKMLCVAAARSSVSGRSSVKRGRAARTTGPEQQARSPTAARREGREPGSEARAGRTAQQAAAAQEDGFRRGLPFGDRPRGRDTDEHRASLLEPPPRPWLVVLLVAARRRRRRDERRAAGARAPAGSGPARGSRKGPEQRRLLRHDLRLDRRRHAPSARRRDQPQRAAVDRVPAAPHVALGHEPVDHAARRALVETQVRADVAQPGLRSRRDASSA